VFKLATENNLNGWVLNDADGVKIHLEGKSRSIAKFIEQLPERLPPAAEIASTEIADGMDRGSKNFAIIESTSGPVVTTRVSPDLPICSNCATDLKTATGKYFNYPYVNCTNCGPRFSIIKSLPYDRAGTTMASWLMCDDCRRDYEDPQNRRFHAQPVACRACGPGYILRSAQQSKVEEAATNDSLLAITKTAALLNDAKIIAIKSIGGYHLVCDALNPVAVENLRTRKFRKDKPFAIMVKDLEAANRLVHLDSSSIDLLTSIAHPIVLAQAKIDTKHLAPDNLELGVMLPYTPLQLMLFEAGCPDALVTTSANKSNEPIAYMDEDALVQLDGIADAFLIGERAIARRIDDSVVGNSKFGISVNRRARGYAPGAVASLKSSRPILALGADLKNSITLVVNGQAFMSQHIGDLEHAGNFKALKETIQDLINMYRLDFNDVVIAHDAHPSYFSTQYAQELASYQTISVQHQRAHIASVLAEKSEFEKRVLGIALDGTGYGDDKAIWGGEFFVGSVTGGFKRVGHLRYASLPGGDAAAKFPPQAAAGFLNGIDTVDFTRAPFLFSERYIKARELLRRDVRCFPTSSMGRLFDAVAALCGFNREISFEAQAAAWLEFQAKQSNGVVPYLFDFDQAKGILDWRGVLHQVIEDRVKSRTIADIARAFHEGLAQSLGTVSLALCAAHNLDTVVFSGGTLQNKLLLDLIHAEFERHDLIPWTNNVVPANDGGISLGQAVIASFSDYRAQTSYSSN
jgi:hydrogenase maturation protein HypF